MQRKPEDAGATSGGSVPTMVFPKELRKHWYDTTDWTAAAFLAVSVVVSLLFVGVIASRDWPDPGASLSKDQLLDLQKAITQKFEAPVELQEADELLELDVAEISNPEFMNKLQAETAKIEASLASSLAEAAQIEKEIAELTGGGDVGDIGSDLAAEMGDLSDLLSAGIGDMGADLGAEGPSLEIAPTDVAIFAEVAGASGSRVVAQAIDVRALGSDVKISSTFTSGGISAADAARLTSQIQLARSRLGSGVKLKIGSGTGGGRRALLRLAGTGKKGKRIQVEQIALPPVKAKARGGRDQTAIDVQVARTRPIIGGCYAIGFAEDPSLSGVVVVKFTIKADGSVTNVGVSQSNLGNPAVESCVVSAVKTWKFAKGKRSETFEFPFTFEPG